MSGEHLTFRQIEDYAAKRLASEQIPALHDHVEICASCRELFVTCLNGGAEHITETEAVDFVAGLLPSRENTRLAGHVEACASCAAMVADLQEFRQTLPSSSQAHTRAIGWLLPIAASLFVVAAVAGWFALRPNHTKAKAVAQLHDTGGSWQLNESGALMAAAALPADDADLLKATLRSGRLPSGPPALLLEPRETLRTSDYKASRQPAMRILSPEGIRVASDRPEFRWSPLDGASSYQVAVFDENLNAIASSGPIHEAVWIPKSPLPRSRPLMWQVAALRNGARITAPVPPEPSPHFEIVSAEAAQRIVAARAAKPPSHLLLAILCAQAGLHREAESEINAISGLNPGSALAASLRNSLTALP